MKPDHLTGEELALVQKEKGAICISIIVPTHRLSPERRVDPAEVEKAVSKAKEYLYSLYTFEEVASVVEALNELYKQIDFTRNAEGIGLFVSHNVRQLVPFYFPVKEKIFIGDAFETRDWLYQVYYSRPYFVLHLTEQGASLFQATFKTLEEIRDKYFPMTLGQEYEYSRPARGSSYVGHAFTKEFERDKSQGEEGRYEDFLKRVDEVLNSYLVDRSPLVVAGAQKDLAYFKKITRHLHTSHDMKGNYAHLPLNELGERSWEAMRQSLDEAKQMLVELWKEKVGEGHGVSGLAAAWQAMQEGRAFKLLVEKDFAVPGYVPQGDESRLYLEPPKEAHRMLPDAVNTLMEGVLEKKGQVVLVENGALANYGGVVSLTRW